MSPCEEWKCGVVKYRQCSGGGVQRQSLTSGKWRYVPMKQWKKHKCVGPCCPLTTYVECIHTETGFRLPTKADDKKKRDRHLCQRTKKGKLRGTTSLLK